MIPFVDLKIQYNRIKGEIQEKINSVLDNTDFILGSEVEKLEKSFADLCNKPYAVAVASGTDALKLALLAQGVEKDDEVILPTNTFVATALAVHHIGAKPIFVDIDEKTYNINPEKIKEKITPKTKAILPVHLYGQPADMDKIMQIAKEHNLKIVEDACQAHNAELNGKKMPYSEIGCFSFYPSKNLGAYGDGGMIVTSNKDLFERLKKLRVYGADKKNVYSLKGFNSRLDTIQAAVLNVKLKYLGEWTEKRRNIAQLYNNLLKGIVITPYEAPNTKPVYHLYVIQTEKRDELMNFLKEKGISTALHYPIPIHKQESFKEHNNNGCPVAENYVKNILSLPMFPEMTEEQVKEVAEEIKTFLNK